MSFQSHCLKIKWISPPFTPPTPGQSKHHETQLQFYYTQEGNHFPLDFCNLITTLSLHQPINHLKWSNKASLAIGPLRCLLWPSVNALPPSSCIFFSLLSPIRTLGTHKMKPLTMLLERQSWSLAIKSFHLNQKLEGTNKNFKRQWHANISQNNIFLYAVDSCSLIPPHHKRRKSSLCFLLPALPTTIALTFSLPLEFWKSILFFQALTTLNKEKLRKQHRLMSPENKEHVYLLISLVCQDHPLACSSWY